MSELRSQWPWVSEKSLHDKEIYTHIVVPGETSDEWKIPVSPPMPGFAYVAIRVCVVHKPEQYSMYPRFVLRDKGPVFGHPWDIQHADNTKWSHLGYPLLHRTFKRGPITVSIAHNSPCFGRVELLAQRFDDLMENDEEISYAYYDPLSNEIGLYHTPDDFFPAVLLEQQQAPSIPKRVKVLHPIRSLLQKAYPMDNSCYQVGTGKLLPK